MAELTDTIAISINEREAAKDRFAHERELAAFNCAALVHDKIHQRAMARLSNDPGMCVIESYCTCPEEIALYRAACRVLTRLFGSHGVSHDETKAE